MSYSTRLAVRRGPRLAAVGLLLAAPLAAQEPSVSAAAACDRATTAMATHPHGQAYADALADLRGCGDRTAAVLAAEWRRRPTDAVELHALAIQSSAVMDRHVADAARAVLVDVSAPRPQRLAALEALVGQVSPALSVTWIDTSASGTPGVPTARVGQRLDMSRPTRGEPSALAPDALVGVLRSLAASDPDAVVRRAATNIAGELDDVYGGS